MNTTTIGSRVGSQFGPYYLRRLLGRGGMGEVYEAFDTVKERVVALKLLSAAYGQDPVFRMRMQREARNAGRLQEPHVVPIHDYGEIDGQLFLDMRLVEGAHLGVLLERFGPMPPARAVTVVSQLASALDAAHDAGVTHRDIKPENILVAPDDFVYLLDFGIATAATDVRMTQMGSAVGTWRYMAPERFSDAEVSSRADVYSLACVLFECLTGHPPYRATSACALISAHAMAPIPRASVLQPGIPQAFDAVIARGMAKRPEDRYASAGQLALAARQSLSAADEQFGALTGSQAYPPPTEAWTQTGPGHAAPVSVPTPARPDLGGSRTLPRPVPAPAGTGPSPQGGHPGTGALHLRNARKMPCAAASVIVAILAAAGLWSGMRSNPSPTPAPRAASAPEIVTTPTPAADVLTGDALTRLLSQVPAGYPANACKPFMPPKDALARVLCEKDTDPGGPPRAIYSVFPDASTLRQFFNGVLRPDIMTDCPSGKKSPSNWRRASNSKARGMVFCAIEQGSPMLVWTNEDELMVGLVEGDSRGTSLDELYRWWNKHS
jgi:predicted Ser/Thr protein kinase